jgi:hypothetical protein
MTTNLLSSLKAVARPEIVSKPPVLAKRMKLIERLEEQAAMVIALIDKQPFTAFKDKTVTNKETGEKTVTKVPRKIRPWYFENNGHYYFEVKLGGTAWEIEPNKPTIDVGDLTNLPEVIKIIISATEKGELDSYLLSTKTEGSEQEQSTETETKNTEQSANSLKTSNKAK